MRIPSGSVDRKLAFVAVDATDLKTRKTALSGFTVYRSRDGGVATVYTTPTVAELSAANMPGVYVLTLDEDTTIAAAHDDEEYVVHITVATMAPVTRAIDIYRVKFTEGQSALMANSAVDITQAGADKVWASATRTLTSFGTLVADVANAVWDELVAEARVAASYGQKLKDLSVTAAGLVDITQTAADKVWASATRTLSAFSTALAVSVWDVLETAIATASSIGLKLKTNLDAAISSRMATYAQPAGFLATTFPAGTVSSSAEIAAVQADTDNLQTRVPAALIGGRMDSDVEAIGNDTTALTAFRRAVLGNVIATVGAASTTTSIVTNSMTPAAAVIDQFKGRIVTFDKDTTTVNLRGQSTDITANTAVGVLTVTALTTAPVNGDTFTIT